MRNPRKSNATLWTILACLALLLHASQLHANAEEKHPIDAAMDAASEANPSTGGQTEAIEAALKQWDALLNQSYQKLIAKLDLEAANKLRDSQRAWVAWRDKELESLGSIYSKLRGTMYVPLGAYARMNLTRQRAMQLERLAQLAEEIE